jgi:hypothetical protein
MLFTAAVWPLKPNSTPLAYAPDVLRFLILPQAKESRMAQFVFGRPLAESDLSDELWLYPVHAASWQPVFAERAITLVKLAQLTT